MLGMKLSVNKFGFNGNNSKFSLRQGWKLVKSCIVGIGATSSLLAFNVRAGYSQTGVIPTFNRFMSTSQIIADYPQHRTGQTINIGGNNYNDVSYLKAFGDLVFTRYCRVDTHWIKNGEYRWQVLERIYGDSSQIEIYGFCEQGSFMAGALFGTRVPNGSTNFNATKVNEFSADKSSVITGESFNLRWNTQNAKSVMITAPGRIFDGRAFPNVGSVQVNASSSPGQDTYTLVVTGSDGYGNNMQVQKQIDISVRNNPNSIGPGNMIQSFSASRNTVRVGESFTISWNVLDARYVLFNGNWAGHTGQQSFTATSKGTRVYTLTVYDHNWKRQDATVEVTVN